LVSIIFTFTVTNGRCKHVHVVTNLHLNLKYPKSFKRDTLSLIPLLQAEELHASALAAIREAEEAKAEAATVLAERRAVQTRAMELVAQEEGIEEWRKEVRAEALRHIDEREAVLVEWEERLKREEAQAAKKQVGI
jgi:hypothetical protein